MKPEMRIVMLRHLLAVLAVLAVAVVLTMAGMNPAAAAGAAGVSVAAAEAATRRRTSRCPTSGSPELGCSSQRGRAAPGPYPDVAASDQAAATLRL